MKVFVLFAILVAATVAISDESFFAGLKNTEFGKTILQTVQLEVRQEGGAQSVLNLLRQMRTDLQQEQSDDNVQVLPRKQSCEQRAQEVQEVIDRANQKRAADEMQLPLLQEEQRDKIQQADDKVGQEQRNQDRLEALRVQRVESKHDYEERRDELVGLVATLQEAKGIIGQLRAGSFLQITDPIMTEIKQHHQKFLKHYPNQRGFHALVTLMLEAMQDSGLSRSQQGVQRVVEVIDNLVESIYEVQKQEMKADDRREQDYQTQRARLELENTRLHGTVATLKAAVEQISQKLLELQNDVASQVQLVDAKSTEQRDWLKTCEDSDRALRQRTDNRNEQLQIINQAVEIFETRFDDNIRFFIQKIKVD